MIKRILLSPWMALLTLLLVVSVRISDPAFVESVRLRYFDQLIVSRPIQTLNIITADIDEATLTKYDQSWPLHRATFATIVEDLYKRGAGLVVLNVLMSEPNRYDGGDDVLAKMLEKHPVVLINVPNSVTKNTPRKPGSVVLNSEYADRIVQYPGIIANISKLEDKAAGIGSVHTLPEIDGVNRRLPLVVDVDGNLYPSLAMETLRVAAGDTTFQVKLSELGVDKLRIPKFGPITTDHLGRIWIDWSQQAQHVSLAQLPDDLDGAIVIVGPTAAGISNPVPTSMGAQFSHWVQATVVGTLANGVNIERPSWADGAEIILIIAFGIVLLFLTRWTYVGIISTVICIGGCIYGSIYLYDNSRWLVDITAIVAGLIIVMFHAYGAKFVSEFLQKQQIKKQFGTYLSPAMVEKLQKNPQLLTLGGESRELSIMFTDVRGFTAISEHYGKNVQGLTKIMNRYMTAMTSKIIENNGTLDKYIGDAQMAFWNAPLDDVNHAKNAVRTALQMMGSLDEFNQEVTSEGVPAFGMGLGINTDTVVVGNMGSSQRFDYTCLGDGVNLAARLEGQSKPYGVKIVLGSETARQIKDEYFVLELDKIAVKGKKVGVHIYTVLSRLDEATNDWTRGQVEHNEMLETYRKQEFDQCITLCDNLLGEFNGLMNDYYSAWRERCVEMKTKTLASDWDGTYVATSK
jgi:adenylate cyclase